MCVKLTKKQREVIVGVLLGDGNLQTFTKGRSYRLRLVHSIKEDFYIKHLYDVFKNITTMTIATQKVKDASDRVYFNTKVHSSLRYYAKLFYNQDKKIVPKNINKLLTPRALAFWFMDDGSRKGIKYKGYRFCTDCYTKKEVNLLCKAMLINFNIKCSVFKQRKKFRIYISEEFSGQFETIIYPFLVKEFISTKINTHSKYY